jgi:Methyltransferase domain
MSESELDGSRSKVIGADLSAEDSLKTVGEAYFPSQKPVSRSVVSITSADHRYGAPLGPIPTSFRRIPSSLEVCRPPASPQELAEADQARAPFLIADYAKPYMSDIVRAFRLLRGMRTYVEIGIFDRGNLNYASSLLAEDALIVGVDPQAEPERDATVRRLIKPGQTYVNVVGDSREPNVGYAVRNALGTRAVDAVFIDGNHTAHAVLCDYVNYGEMIKPGGFVLFHDSLWEGDDTFKGSGDAIAEIDKLDPIYLVPGEGPCYRFMRPLWRDSVWGVVGVHCR